jgi:FkbM family methyltransferase
MSTLANLVQIVLRQPLNRNRPFESAVRFLRWQIGSRVLGREVVVDWVNGARLFARTGETGVTGNIYAGLHEFEDMAFVLHSLRDGDHFVDVGANSGSYTILACAAAGARGHAFEPVPATFARLTDNVRLNRLEDRVHCVRSAVGASAASIRFTSGFDTTNHALAAGDSADGSIEVPVVPLDAALAGDAPDLMKVDVEGFETHVIDGAAATLADRRLNAVVMELNGAGARYGFDDAAIVARMEQAGFSRCAYDPFTRTLRARAAGDLDTAGNNVLFVRDLDRAAERLRSAPRFRVLGQEI